MRRIIYLVLTVLLLSPQLLLAGDPDCILPDAGLVGWWRFNESSGATAADTIGANTGTAVNTSGGATEWVAGEVGNAFDFDGVDDYVDVGNDNDTVLQLSTGSLEFWFESPKNGTDTSGFLDGDWRGLVCKPDAWCIWLTNANQMYMTKNYNYPGMHSGGLVYWSGAYASSTLYSPPDWNHFAMTFADGVTDGLIIYLNGVMIESDTLTIVNQDSNIVFGTVDSASTSTDVYFNGAIDEVSMYNTVLASAQIADIYAAGTAGKCECGDADVAVAEGCDDGNATAADGCSVTCAVEDGWTCNGEPSVCESCGNGKVEGTEECDDGNTVADDGCLACAVDSDRDGTGDSTDTDDDNDGTADTNDAFPVDATETTDTDGDGTGDNADPDDDGDGVADTDDAFPKDKLETRDTDGDGVGDASDALPTNASETTDTDGDGIGDNADTDDDGDGTADTSDAFPVDASETTDTDGDGTGDNADTDDDGDGVADTADNCPAVTNADQKDTDGDGKGDACDLDADGGGVNNTLDPRPLYVNSFYKIDKAILIKTCMTAATGYLYKTIGGSKTLGIVTVKGVTMSKAQPKSYACFKDATGAVTIGYGSTTSYGVVIEYSPFTRTITPP